ncbi:MAG: recombinase A [Polyangia bacterium]
MVPPLHFEARLANALVRLPELAQTDEPRFCLDELSGRLTELRHAGGALSWVFSLVTEVQQRGEVAAYVCGPGATFYPPDAFAGGVDLAALPIVLTEDLAARARAADELLRSGAFALVVVDLVGATGRVSPALLTRLHGLVQKHHSALVFVTDEAADGTIGSLVSLRAVARRTTHPDLTRCRITLDVMKDKRRAPGWSAELVRSLPPGLR